MKKVIATSWVVVCPVCNKNGILAREFDDHTAEIIHKDGTRKYRCEIKEKATSPEVA